MEESACYLSDFCQWLDRVTTLLSQILGASLTGPSLQQLGPLTEILILHCYPDSGVWGQMDMGGDEVIALRK